MAFALRRRQRLVSSREIQDVLNEPSESKHYGVLRAVRRDSSLGTARLGIGISKRHVKSAVRRNLIKRVIREWFRLHRAEFGDWDVMVLSTPKLQNATSSLELKNDLRRALARLAADLRSD